MNDAKDILLPFLQNIIYYGITIYKLYPTLSICFLIIIVLAWKLGIFKRIFSNKENKGGDREVKERKDGDLSLKAFFDNPWVFVAIMLVVLTPKVAQNKEVQKFAEMGTVAQAQMLTPIDSSKVKSQQDFINTVAEYACQHREILPSITIAQACLESDFGESILASKYNNLYGIKGSYQGKSINLQTNEEYTVGNISTINDNFRLYPNWSNSIQDYQNLLKTDRYASVSQQQTAEAQITKIKECGYATDSQYINKVLNIVNNYNLKVWDKMYRLPVDGRISSTFGLRDKPAETASANHQGIDIVVPTGTKIRSIIGGTVTRYTDSASGNYVIVSNGNYEEVFCHMSKFYDVSDVNAGDYVGESGNSGSATTGAHLHYGFRVNKVYVDPLKYIKQ